MKSATSVVRRHVPQVPRIGICIAVLLLGACANTPTNRMGIPWWPQGPGNAEEVASAGGRTQQASAQESAQPASGNASSTASVQAPTPPPAASPAPAPASAPPAPMPAPAPEAASDTSQNNSYTQAVRYGDLLFVSGQIALDPATHQLVSGAVDLQTRAAMDNVQRILQQHGMTMSNVLSVTLYLKNISDLSAVDEAYASYFRRSLPARTVVEVANLPRGSLVEIAVVAGR